MSSFQDSAYEREGMCTDNHLRRLDKLMKKKWGNSFTKMKLKYEERSGRDFREEAHTQVHYGIKKYKRSNSRGMKKWFNTILKMHGKNLNKFHGLK